MSGKRGQSEDFFGDLIPAIVIIVLALAIGTMLSISSAGRIEGSVKSASVSFDGPDVLALLHSPVESYGDVAHLLAVVSDAYETGDAEAVSGMARFGSDYAECNEGFETAVGGFFSGKRWAVSVYEVVDPDDYSDGKMIFKCGSLESFADPAIAVGTGIHRSEAYLPSSGFTAYKVSMGWKDE